MTVTVYSKPACVQCTSSMRKLNNMGIEYTKTDMSEDPTALAYVKSLGFMAAPVLIVQDADGNVIKSWSGFRPDEIDALASDVLASA